MRHQKIESLKLYHIVWYPGTPFFDNQEFIMLGFRNDNRSIMTHIIPYHPYLKYFKWEKITKPGFLAVAIKPSGWSFARTVDEWWDVTWNIIARFDEMNRSDLPLFMHWNRGELFEQLLKGNK